MANSDSSNLSDLKSFLEAHDANFVSEVKANRTPPVDFALFVPADRVSNRVEKDRTSFRQMKLLQHAIKDHLGLEIEWIVVPGSEADALEAALYQLLEMRCPAVVNAVYISSLRIQPVTVWIELTSSPTSRVVLPKVEGLIHDFLKLHGIESPIIMSEDREELPTKPMILRTLKIHAPVTTNDLAEVLRGSGSDIPNTRWLQSKLDALRKHGLITRSEDGEYTTTELGLAVVPHGRYRTSSDIERALAFGKREW